MKDGCAVWDESTIKVHESQKFTEFAVRCGGWEISNGLNLFLKWADASGVHQMAQKLKRRHTEDALRHIDEEAMLV